MSERVLIRGVPVYVEHDHPPVEALAVVDGVVAAVGPLDLVRSALDGPAEEVELSDGAVMPAFVDPHQHAWLVAVDPFVSVLTGAGPDVAGLLARVGALVGAERGADEEGPGRPHGWYRYHGYEPLRLAEHRSPTARELDSVVRDRPVHVLSRTYHESVVNSAGLAALGISRTTPDPPGGRIVRDRRGEPTGVLIEAASFAAEAVSRPPHDASVLGRLQSHGRRLLAYGITRIGDAATPADRADELVATLATVGVDAVPLLVGARIDEPALVPGATAKVLVDGGEYCDLCFSRRQVAALVRSSVQAQLGPQREVANALARRSGMLRREPDGWHSGLRFPTADRLSHLLAHAADVGAGIAAHAVGNGAVDRLLEAARTAPPQVRAALRVEHAMTISATDAQRLADAGLPVVAQPSFLVTYGHDLAASPLPKPLTLIPLQTLRTAGVELSFSSDFPAVDLSPWVAIQAAVTRQDATGAELLADEAVTVGQALAAYTSAAGRVLGSPGAGTLRPGARADLIWTDRDPYRAPSAELARITARVTWRAGAVVHGSLPSDA